MSPRVREEVPVADPDLRCLLIGFAGGRLLVPGGLVVEALPYAPPLRVEGAPPWVLGSLLWRARTVPLIGMEPLLAGSTTITGPRSRIVVLRTPGGRVGHVAVVTVEVPQLLTLARADLHALDDDPLPPGVLRRVRLHDGEALIPALDHLDAELAALGIYRN